MGKEQVALSHMVGLEIGSSQHTLNTCLAKTTRDTVRTTSQGKGSGECSPKVVVLFFF